MKPKEPAKRPQNDLFRMELENLIDRRHELVGLSEVIDWEGIASEFGILYVDRKGRPGIPTRLMAGLLYLKATFKLSDEDVVRRWVENPYWQFFCGETYFRHELPIHPTSLTRFRKRIGGDGCELLLSHTIDAGLKTKTVEQRDLDEVVVDTTVMEKAIAHPTDSRLYHRSRERLVKLAKCHGIPLRQSYVRKSRHTLAKVGRYGHARQYKRLRRETKRLKTWLGRVVRDIERKIADHPDHQAAFANELQLAHRLLKQQRHDKRKLYSLHAPEVECISKGKVRKPYEFGVKVSVATTLRSNFVLASHAMPGNPYDGHTLAKTLLRCFETTGKVVKAAFVDRGYRGCQSTDYRQLYIAGQRRGMTPTLKRKLKRRNAIEPIIGHMKAEGHLDRNYLKGPLGDAINALIAGAGQNLRMILKKLRLLLAWLLNWRFMPQRNRLAIADALAL
jgi:transposase, IS5 family